MEATARISTVTLVLSALALDSQGPGFAAAAAVAVLSLVALFVSCDRLGYLGVPAGDARNRETELKPGVALYDFERVAYLDELRLERVGEPVVGVKEVNISA